MSSHPSYYAAGRPLLTQERLARRRDRENLRFSKLDQNHRYFSAWDAQSQMMDSWNQQHSEKDRKVHVTLPPFDCDEQQFRTKGKHVTAAKLQSVTQDLRNTVHSLNELESDAMQTKETSLKILSHITVTRNKRHDVTEALLTIDLKRRKVVNVRTARDRLVHHLFLVLEKSQLMESTVKQCFPLIDSQIYYPEEQQDLLSVLKSTESIARVMLSLNNTRHQDISSMYTEEATHCYDELMQQWEEEDEMIRQVLEKVFETIESTLMEKLEANLELEEELLQSRKSQVERLASQTSSLKSDQALWSQLDTNAFRETFQLIRG